MDAAVIILDKPVNWNAHPNIRPICLPPGGTIENFMDKPAMVTGWGLKGPGRTAEVLQKGLVSPNFRNFGCITKKGGFADCPKKGQRSCELFKLLLPFPLIFKTLSKRLNEGRKIFSIGGRIFFCYGRKILPSVGDTGKVW